MRLCNLRILLVLSLLIGFGSFSSVWAEATTDTALVNVKVEQWKGHSFTFLALVADKEAGGYGIFPVAQADAGFSGDRSVRIPYATHVGKQVTVTETVPFVDEYKQQDFVVYMTVNDTGEKLVGRTLHGQLEGVVLTADLTNARQQFLGKTVYPKFRELSGLYLPGVNTTPQSVGLKIAAPVTVLDVYTGNTARAPIWLIVSVNGQKATLPISYSWTNRAPQYWTENLAWQDSLFAEDPTTIIGGSHYIWSQIEAGNVEEGMTKAQIELSWGKPVNTEAGGKVWFYGPMKLIFDGDVLKTMENTDNFSMP